MSRYHVPRLDILFALFSIVDFGFTFVVYPFVMLTFHLPSPVPVVLNLFFCFSLSLLPVTLTADTRNQLVVLLFDKLLISASASKNKAGQYGANDGFWPELCVRWLLEDGLKYKINL